MQKPEFIFWHLNVGILYCPPEKSKSQGGKGAGGNIHFGTGSNAVLDKGKMIKNNDLKNKKTGKSSYQHLFIRILSRPLYVSTVIL